MKPYFSETPRCFPRRRALMMAEVVAALSVLLVALMLVAEIGGWSIAERGRNAARQQALEEAANVLEMARARAWDELTPDWAMAQRLQEPSGRLHDGKLGVRVEGEPNRPRTKRVTAVVSWNHGSREEKVEMVALFSARSGDAGGKP